MAAKAAQKVIMSVSHLVSLTNYKMTQKDPEGPRRTQKDPKVQKDPEGLNKNPEGPNKDQEGPSRTQ